MQTILASLGNAILGIAMQKNQGQVVRNSNYLKQSVCSTNNKSRIDALVQCRQSSTMPNGKGKQVKIGKHLRGDS